MNAKYIFALIFALQASMSLCDIPPPSQAMVDIYNTHKSTFIKRLVNFYHKVQAAAGPVVHEAANNQQVEGAREFVQDLQSKPEFQALVKVASGIGQEAGPVVERTRTAALGLYEHYVRPYVGTALSQGIDHAKVFLDEVLPAE